MSKRIVTSLVAAAAVALGTVLVAAQPAAAAPTPDWTITTDCAHNATLPAAAQPGDLILIRLLPSCTASGAFVNVNGTRTPHGGTATNGGFLDVVDIVNSPYSGPDGFPGFTGDWFAYADGSADTWVYASLRSTDFSGTPLQLGSVVGAVGPGYATYTITYGDGADSSTPIPMWDQAYGRVSADTSCEDGWVASWQEWAVPVTGGWVCTRSIRAFG